MHDNGTCSRNVHCVIRFLSLTRLWRIWDKKKATRRPITIRMPMFEQKKRKAINFLWRKWKEKKISSPRVHYDRGLSLYLGSICVQGQELVLLWPFAVCCEFISHAKSNLVAKTTSIIHRYYQNGTVAIFARTVREEKRTDEGVNVSCRDHIAKWQIELYRWCFVRK